MLHTLPLKAGSLWSWWNTPIATERNQAFQERLLRILLVFLWGVLILAMVYGVVYGVVYGSFSHLWASIAFGIITNGVATYAITKGNTLIPEITISMLLVASLISEVFVESVASRDMISVLYLFAIIGFLLFSRLPVTVVYVAFVGYIGTIFLSMEMGVLAGKESGYFTEIVAVGMGVMILSAFRHESNRRLDEIARLAHEAEEANQLKSRFLATVSHELRTPLNAILNFSKFVSTGRMGDVNDRQVKALNNVIVSGNHLLSLINDILEISRIESDSLQLYIESDVDLSKIILHLQTMGDTLLGDKPVKLAVHIEDELPVITADRQRIHQILLNLVSNACKFTETGQIMISAKRSDASTIIIAVKDTGSGIPLEDQEKIFDVFTQTERGIIQGEGTGLGLAISKRLAEAHHGSLWVESAEGQGATFYLSLPITLPSA